MIVKLPIKINDKIQNQNFNVQIENDKIIVTTEEKKNNYLQIVYTNNFGIQFYPIYFPLTFLIDGKYLINEYYFIFSLLYENDICNNNFFYLLIKFINEQINSKFEIIKINTFNLVLIEQLIKKINDNYIFSTKISEHIKFDTFLHNIFSKYQFYLNISLSLMYITNLNKQKINPSKRVKNCIKQIYNQILYLYGRNDSFEKHLSNIKLKKIKKNIEINNFVFFENKNKKIMRIYVKNIDDTYIYLNEKKVLYNNYNLYYYPPKFLKLLNIKNIFYNIINSNELFNLINIIFKNDSEYDNIKNYFLSFDKKNIINSNFLKNTSKDDIYHILEQNKFCDESINYNVFIDKVKNAKYNKNTFLTLINNYIFPLNYNKTDFSLTFKKILYYIYKFNKEIKNDKLIENNYQNKYKNLFIFIINFYNQYICNDLSVLNNTKIYTDNLYFTIINIHFTDKFKLFVKDDKYYFFKNKFFKNFKLFQVINFLNWNNFKYNLNKFKLLSENRDDKFLFFENKIKRNFYINFDNNLLKMIYNPFLMCQHLLKKNDFVKWIKLFRNDINLIFDNTIKIEGKDYEKIGKILYYISSIKEQNMNNNNYKTVINYLCNNKHLITYNGRININIKETLNNKNINLGYLSKHILGNKIDSITFSESDEDYEEINERYKSTKKKYYKYKSKYLDLKSSELSSNINK